MIIRRIVFFGILVLIGFGILIQVFFALNFEPRTYFWRITDGGIFALVGISLLLLYYFYLNIFIGKFLRSTLFVIPLIIFSTCSVMSTISYPKYTDCLIYQNKDNEYIIVQYYETGLTGNPRTRVIKTSSKDAPVRHYKELTEDIFPNRLDFDGREWDGVVDHVAVDRLDYKLKEIKRPY